MQKATVILALRIVRSSIGQILGNFMVINGVSLGLVLEKFLLRNYTFLF